jgi:hypothetical protein
MKKRKRKKKKAKDENEKDVQAESDPFRGLYFNQMLSSTLPNTWERSNLDSPYSPPSHRLAIEDIVCPRCGVYLVEDNHKDNCSSQ